jgi:uncharacterized membrane protein HdeD (DUF308 family)
MTSETTRVQEAISDWAGEARKNAGWLIGFGVLTVIAGVFAIVAPLGSGLGITIFIGLALVIGGGARIIAAFGADSFGQGALAFIGGLLGAVAGVILATRPGLGLATLTLLIGSYLLVDGIASAVLAFRVRPDQGWGWILFSGIVTVLLGILLLAEWPLSGTWALGTLVGVNLLFSGSAMISIGSAARRLTKTAAA